MISVSKQNTPTLLKAQLKMCRPNFHKFMSGWIRNVLTSRDHHIHIVLNEIK